MKTNNKYRGGLASKARLKFQKGGSVSVEKAKKILRDGKIRGKPLTAKQKRFFGFIAGGGTPTKLQGGGVVSVAEAKEIIKKGQVDGKPLTKQQKNYYSFLSNPSSLLKLQGGGSVMTDPDKEQGKEVTGLKETGAYDWTPPISSLQEPSANKNEQQQLSTGIPIIDILQYVGGIGGSIIKSEGQKKAQEREAKLQSEIEQIKLPKDNDVALYEAEMEREKLRRDKFEETQNRPQQTMYEGLGALVSGQGLGFYNAMEGLKAGTEEEKLRQQKQEEYLRAKRKALLEIHAGEEDFSLLRKGGVAKKGITIKPNTKVTGKTGGKVVGKGTSTSDSIPAIIPPESFVVPSKNAKTAEQLREKYLTTKGTKKMNLQKGGVPVKLSSGEHVFTPKEVKKLTKAGVDLDLLAPEAEVPLKPGAKLQKGTADWYYPSMGDIYEKYYRRKETKSDEEIKKEIKDLELGIAKKEAGTWLPDVTVAWSDKGKINALKTELKFRANLREWLPAVKEINTRVNLYDKNIQEAKTAEEVNKWRKKRDEARGQLLKLRNKIPRFGSDYDYSEQKKYISAPEEAKKGIAGYTKPTKQDLGGRGVLISDEDREKALNAYKKPASKRTPAETKAIKDVATADEITDEDEYNAAKEEIKKAKKGSNYYDLLKSIITVYEEKGYIPSKWEVKRTAKTPTGETKVPAGMHGGMHGEHGGIKPLEQPQPWLYQAMDIMRELKTALEDKEAGKSISARQADLIDKAEKQGITTSEEVVKQPNLKTFARIGGISWEDTKPTEYKAGELTTTSGKEEEQELKFNAADIAAIGQVGVGLAGLISEGKRPEDIIPKEILSEYEKAKGLRLETEYPIQDILTGIRRRYRDVVSAIPQIAGGSPRRAFGYMSAAGTRASEEEMRARGAKARFEAAREMPWKLGKARLTSGLAGTIGGYKRQLFEDKLRDYEQRQYAYANALQAGISNIVGRQELKDILEILKT